MSQSRRDFLRAAGFAAGALLPASKMLAAYKPSRNFGLQLYSVRDDIAKDPKGVLKQIASYGYTQIESFEGKQGMFWGMQPKEFKQFTGDLGLTIISSHCDYKTDFEKKAADAASIGMKYLICPYKGPQKSIDDFKRCADEFNKAGAICKKNGIRFAYHNHDYSFKSVDGQIPQDVMIENTDPSLVDFEMDIYWVVTAGADPVAYMKKYNNRFRLCHVKDRQKGATTPDASVIAGTGSIDFRTLLPQTKKYGMKYFIIEQERYDQGTPLECAKADAEYMKTLSL
ncbi:sugar phosphate isomerase/epimerase family protein [Deminuibacter soli]|uniref:Sugar phosphate isomerase/epimerase n=1 Tax=Deminuibacter soli TaxID=2291815 RepID=A0A3E1NR26_9BACT|nr:sugar phosphate isomerase/epimerase [Deminuibacter soli]RFM30409.1 sugar phosphate isomerase/epimerase [Deminuibacter soli]